MINVADIIQSINQSINRGCLSSRAILQG